MKSYQEMAEAVFREGDKRLAVHQKKRRRALTGGAVGAVIAGCLIAVGVWRHSPAVVPKALPGTPVTAAVTQTSPPAATTDRTQTTTEPHSQPAETTTAPQPSDQTTRSQEESTAGGLAPDRESPSVTERTDPPPQTETPQADPSTENETPPAPSGAASYNSENWTEAPVNHAGWARFPRWPGYEDKFWVYYDGRTYRCDPFAGRPLAYGDYLCALSDCAHDFADEDGAGVYVMLEDGKPVPTTAAVVIVFPDGTTYAMIRPDTD